VLVALLGLLEVAVAGQSSDFLRDVRPILEKRCFECHSGEQPKGGVDLSLAQDGGEARRMGSVFARAISMVERRKMPPESRRPLKDDERAGLVAALKEILSHPEPGESLDPGRVVLRRLSRFEFDRAIRDLLGARYDSSATFPADPIAYGFDNIGDAMSVAPLLFEKYADAARDVVDRLLRDDVLRERLLAPALKRGGVCNAAVARQILMPLMERAFRRPVEADEVNGRVDLFLREVQAGRDATAALATALRSILLSPAFLFRAERGVDPPDEFGVRPLSDYELATRLSFFLWSTLPDATLLELARRGRLHQEEVLIEQARRMLIDPRARALTDHFAAEWLRFGEIQSVAVDIRRYPAFFNLGLRERFYDETARTFDAIVREDRSVLELLDCESTFLDAELARHYGVEGVGPGPMRRIALHDPRRGGLLGMGSILTITSYPLRTSPVLRGKWILETLLDDPPPPKPATVPELPKDDRLPGGLTLRQRLEEHRKDPACANCHQRMDPFGLALENLDGIGAWRSALDGPEAPIDLDVKVALADGSELDGAVAVKRWLVAHAGRFEKTLTRRLLTFAVGRPMEFLDEPLVEAIAADAASDGHRMSAFVLGVVRSRPFRYLRRD
jgi:uncharacterized protein DUF1592/uncharacterized protein DUF1588/uncharacterized protein DUF1587/uncharacterized protein DUF1585/uncharacterized protein DUF1595